MKPKTEAKALDKAVKALAMATEKSWSSCTAQQQFQKLQELKKFLAPSSREKPSVPDSNQSV